MRIYLDNCCLQRPLDDRTQPRIKVETEAVFAVLAAVQSGEQVLPGSLALASVARADFFCTCDDKLFRRARQFSGLSCGVTTLLGLVPEVVK